MPCCKCCCGNKDCEEGEQGKCCCGGPTGTCCQEGHYCCDGVCQEESCSLCVVCPEKTCEIDWPADGAFIDGVGYNKKGAGQYYAKTEGGLEYRPCCPAMFGFPGSLRSQSVWKFGAPPSVQYPQPNPPEFTWNEGYPGNYEECLYWVADFAIAIGDGLNCCRIAVDPQTGQQSVNCDDRVNGLLLSSKDKFRWRLMLLDCQAETLTDVTDDAVTQVQPFEDEKDGFVEPFDRDCEETGFTAMPDFFDDPEPVCNE